MVPDISWGLIELAFLYLDQKHNMFFDGVSNAMPVWSIEDQESCDTTPTPAKILVSDVVLLSRIKVKTRMEESFLKITILPFENHATQVSLRRFRGVNPFGSAASSCRNLL